MAAWRPSTRGRTAQLPRQLPQRASPRPPPGRTRGPRGHPTRRSGWRCCAPWACWIASRAPISLMPSPACCAPCLACPSRSCRWWMQVGRAAPHASCRAWLLMAPCSRHGRHRVLGRGSPQLAPMPLPLLLLPWRRAAVVQVGAGTGVVHPDGARRVLLRLDPAAGEPVPASGCCYACCACWDAAAAPAARHVRCAASPAACCAHVTAPPTCCMLPGPLALLIRWWRMRCRTSGSGRTRW